LDTKRRAFLQTASAALAAGLGTTINAAEERPGNRSGILDYGLSFICNDASFNNVRFWIESRTTIFDKRNDTASEYYQCGSCKSENTFAPQNLFVEDNYDFLPILGESTWLIFRRPCRLSDSYRQVSENVWGQPDLKLRYAKKVQELDGFESIRDATAAGLPIVAQTEISNEAQELSAVIEYPTKTMNISIDDSVYQIDTGPIALPDLEKRYAQPIDTLRLAFVAFNSPDFADFVVEQPTPVIQHGQELAQVYHYSKPFSLPAKNRLYAASLPE
jgi:hypothetical protein